MSKLIVHQSRRCKPLLGTERGAIRTRWGVVDLLLSLMRLDAEGTIPCPGEVMSFFGVFEDERRAGAAELSDLRSTVIGLAADEVTEEELELPMIKPDMLTYLNAFTREGATGSNVATRAKVMVNRLRQYLQEAS